MKNILGYFFIALPFIAILIAILLVLIKLIGKKEGLKLFTFGIIGTAIIVTSIWIGVSLIF